MNLNNKPFLLTLAFAALFAAIISFAAAPLTMGIKDIGLEIWRQQERIADYDNRILNAREFSAFTRGERANLDKLSGVFVDSQMPLDFIHSLETAAQDAGTAIRFSSSSQPREDEFTGWPMVDFEMDVSGEAAAVLRFVRKLETSPYLVTVKSIEMRTAAETGNSTAAGAKPEIAPGQVSAHILIEVYSKRR